MQLLGLVLILLNFGAIATPIAGIVLLNSSDLSQIIIPSEVEEIISNTINTEESIERMGILAAQNVIQVLLGREPIYRVI